MGPEMTRVFFREALPRITEGLAGAAPGPDRTVIRPSGEAERVGPPADAGEEMGLVVPLQILGLDVHDAALVNIAISDVSGVNEVAKPGGGVGVKFIVVRPHASNSSMVGTMWRARRNWPISTARSRTRFWWMTAAA